MLDLRLDGVVLRAVVTAICAGLLLNGCGSDGGGSGGAVTAIPTAPNAFAESVPFTPTPDKDPFYHQPLNFPDKPPGSILQSRAIAFNPTGIPMPNKAWQIQFVSTDVNGRPIAATAAVVKPLSSSPSGKSPLVAYGFAYNSLGTDCNPSKSAAGATASNAEWPLILPGLQTQGWTVVLPDYLGPFNSYAAGKLTGQVTLDALRAAAQFEPLGLDKQTPMGIWGYSGGAIATAWAASLQPTYAPELNLKAVATGGTPADTDLIIRHVSAEPVANATGFSLIFSAVQGINRSYPQFVTSILNEKGRAAFISQKDGCGGSTTDGSEEPAGKLADYMTVSDPFESPGMKEVALLNRLPQPGLTPKAPTYVYHEVLDELIPVAVADAMVKKWCEDGAAVTYSRNTSGEHVVGAYTGGLPAFAWLVSTLNGQASLVLPPASKCN